VLPTFIIIGAQKAGTTSLYYYLGRHPRVFLSDKKELEYFLEERNWGLGPKWYESQFDQARNALAVGEASTAYTAHPVYSGVPERMVALVPDVRLIYLFRDPIERMQSAYAYFVHLGVETRPIEEALFADPRYLAMSNYAWQIARYLEHFPSEHLLVIPSEDLRSRKVETLSRIHTFIGVPPEVLPSQTAGEYNRASDKKVSGRTAVRLRNLPGYQRIVSVTPKSVRLVYRRFTARKDRISTELSPEVRAKLLERLDHSSSPAFSSIVFRP